MTSADPTATGGSAPEGPVSTLRGAGVQVNTRIIVRVIVSICLVTLAVLVVVFGIAGAHKNDQINELRTHGIRVKITTIGCLGLLGGSGSNAAGYACRGTFTLNGHRYTESIPGSTLHRPGSEVLAVAVPGSPPLLDLPATVASEHASQRVFILPLVLLVVLGLAVAGLVVRSRRRQMPAST